MTDIEFAHWVMAAQGYYSKEEKFLGNDAVITLWFEQLKDLDYKVAEAALNKYAATNKWSPSLADIREIATSISMGELPDWGEAWQEVVTAIRRYGSYRAAEAIESLSPLTRKAVEYIGGYYHLCASENSTADRANFRDTYSRLVERQKQDAQLPEGLKVLIAQMQQPQLIENQEK